MATGSGAVAAARSQRRRRTELAVDDRLVERRVAAPRYPHLERSMAPALVGVIG